MKKKTSFTPFSVIVSALLWILVAGCFGNTPNWQIRNPYEQVNWETYGKYKANLHTHTTRSDGLGKPQEVVLAYVELEYAILALTDHDTKGAEETTWPWQQFGITPESFGIVAVEGNEISNVHHIGSYFNGYGDAQVSSAEAAILEIGHRGGLAVFFHPGRYHKSVDWYVALFRSHPHLIGLEIFNQGDRYPDDRKRWDAILKCLSAERPVWGFSNDDMHDPATQLGRNWNVMLLPELSAPEVRNAMEKGVFFYVYAKNGHTGEAPPDIQRIQIDPRMGIIRLFTVGDERIEWISEGRLVHTGNSIALSATSGVGSYVRAVVYGAGGTSIIGTQPFYLKGHMKKP